METSASRPLLEVLSGPCRGARAPLGRAACIIGDDDGCDLLLGPPRSRAAGSRYAALRVDADGVWLARPDAEGVAAAETRLAPGDEFDVAGVRCRVRVVDERGAPDDDTAPTPGPSLADAASTGAPGHEAPEARDGGTSARVARDAADFAAALARAATRTECDPAGAADDAVRSGSSGEGRGPSAPRARLRRRAVVSTLVLVAGLAVGGALTDGPLFAMQGRHARPAATSGPVTSTAATRQAVDAVQARLARAGVARWVGVARDGEALRLLAFTDQPAQASAIRRALTDADVRLPVQVMGESAVLAQVDAALQAETQRRNAPAGATDAATRRASRLRAIGTGPGRIRIAGLVDTRADAAAVTAYLRDRFPALKAIECDVASDADVRHIVSPLLREPPPEVGPGGVAARLVAASGDAPALPAATPEGADWRLLVDAPPAALDAIGQRLAAAALAQNQVLAVALANPTAAGDHGPAPRMIVMGPRPYAVLADGVTVFAGDALGDRVVARIERDAIRLLPAPGGSS